MSLTPVRNSRTRCGYCASGNHQRCAVGTVMVRHAKYPGGVVWICSCEEAGCTEGRRKCRLCNNRNTDEVSAETWTCLDVEGCHSLVAERHAADPLLAQLRESKERAHMAQIEDTKTKAETKAKEKAPTFCLVTGEPTKGGLFKPGMDARYVSERVIEVENAKFSDAATEKARKRLTKDGVSEKLVAKFEKSLGLAKERADKKVAAAKAKAEAAEAAKAEKAEKAKA